MLRSDVPASGRAPLTSSTFNPAPSETGPGVLHANLGNKASAEGVTEWEVGTELGLFNDSLVCRCDVPNRTVNDAMVARQFRSLVDSDFSVRQHW